jgi:hypothetical protein
MEKKILRPIINEPKHTDFYDSADDVRHAGNSAGNGDARLFCEITLVKITIPEHFSNLDGGPRGQHSLTRSGTSLPSEAYILRKMESFSSRESPVFLRSRLYSAHFGGRNGETIHLKQG